MLTLWRLWTLDNPHQDIAGHISPPRTYPLTTILFFFFFLFLNKIPSISRLQSYQSSKNSKYYLPKSTYLLAKKVFHLVLILRGKVFIIFPCWLILGYSLAAKRFLYVLLINKNLSRIICNQSQYKTKSLYLQYIKKLDSSLIFLQDIATN